MAGPSRQSSVTRFTSRRSHSSPALLAEYSWPDLVDGILSPVDDAEDDDLLGVRPVVVEDVLLDRQAAAAEKEFILCVAEFGMNFQQAECVLDRHAVGRSLPLAPGAAGVKHDRLGVLLG